MPFDPIACCSPHSSAARVRGDSWGRRPTPPPRYSPATGGKAALDRVVVAVGDQRVRDLTEIVEADERFFGRRDARIAGHAAAGRGPHREELLRDGVEGGWDAELASPVGAIRRPLLVVHVAVR